MGTAMKDQLKTIYKRLKVHGKRSQCQSLEGPVLKMTMRATEGTTATSSVKDGVRITSHEVGHSLKASLLDILLDLLLLEGLLLVLLLLLLHRRMKGFPCS